MFRYSSKSTDATWEQEEPAYLSMGSQLEEGRHERIGKSSKEDRKHEVREKEGNLGNVPFDLPTIRSVGIRQRLYRSRVPASYQQRKKDKPKVRCWLKPEGYGAPCFFSVRQGEWWMPVPSLKSESKKNYLTSSDTGIVQRLLSMVLLSIYVFSDWSPKTTTTILPVVDHLVPC